MSAAKRILAATIGAERTEQISLRAYVLDSYGTRAVLLGILYVIVLVLTIRRILFRKKSVPASSARN